MSDVKNWQDKTAFQLEYINECVDGFGPVQNNCVNCAAFSFGKRGWRCAKISNLEIDMLYNPTLNVCNEWKPSE